MTIIDECRKWAAEMHKEASALEADPILPKSPRVVEVIDRDRAVGDTLAKAAYAIEQARALLLIAAKACAMLRSTSSIRTSGPPFMRQTIDVPSETWDVWNAAINLVSQGLGDG